MTLSPTFGSQSLANQLQRAGTRMRQDVQRHSLEMTTGQSADPAARLRGNLGPLAMIDTRLHRIGAQEIGLKSALQLTETAQTALGSVATIAGRIRDELMTVAGMEPTGDALSRVGATARLELSAMISALSVSDGGRAPFSGRASDRGPLPDADTLLAAVAAHVAGAATADDVIAGVADFFDAPGGPFETVIYAGADPVAPGAAALGVAVDPLPTAADPAIRATLREAVLASLLNEPGVSQDLGLRQQLARKTVDRQFQAIDDLVGLRGRVGRAEAALDDGISRLSLERDTLMRNRDGMIGVDPFEAASRLEETRARLEALYVVTARVARLSLTEYLR